jgi:PAB-dependent poly(A)-specific ribonuclease subunit 2
MKPGLSYICAATNMGAVHFIDSITLKVVKTWQAHNGWISDMDVKTDFIITCGYSPRANFGPLLDGLANVFNLKTLAPLPPIPFQAGAAFVCIHPRMSTTCVIASAQGQLQVVDIDNPNALASIKQAQIYDNTILTHLEMAPSGKALTFTTTLHQIHLWGSPNNIQFNEFGNSQPTLFADQPAPHPPMDWSLDT